MVAYGNGGYQGMQFLVKTGYEPGSGPEVGPAD